MIKYCVKCKSKISKDDKVYYTLNSKLLSVACCSMDCASSFKNDTIDNLEKIIGIIKDEDIAER